MLRITTVLPLPGFMTASVMASLGIVAGHIGSDAFEVAMDRVVDIAAFDTVDGSQHGGLAPAEAVDPPPPAPVSDPPTAAPAEPRVEIDPGEPVIVRRAVGDRVQDMIVRATPGGWCVLVPPGPELVVVMARGWVWFVRQESTAARARIGLYQVASGGGIVTRVAWVPAMPARLHFRNFDIYAYDNARPRRELWADWVTELRPTDPPTCHGLTHDTGLSRSPALHHSSLEELPR